MIQCRMMLEVDTLTWKKYRVLSRDIAECAKTIKNIGTTIQVENQRKLTEDINQTETILRVTGVRSPAIIGGVFQRNVSHLNQQPHSV
ncbi:hypothetical protein C8R44DRAFT_977682 [Mycena epipterygia]|nr:hypothetical protein C8R44DRAFT_977682 [Mycena epipterygia]